MTDDKKYLKLTTVLFRSMQNFEKVLKNDILAYGLNPTEFGTLELIYHKGKQPIQTICNRLLMANSSMTYVVDQLEKKGYVRRSSSKNDKRATLIDLTDQGKIFFESIFPNHINKTKQVFEVLEDKDIDVLIELLKKIGLKAQEMNGGKI